MRRRRRKNQYIFAQERPGGQGRAFFRTVVTVLALLLVAVVITNFVINHQVNLKKQSITVQNLPGDLENWSILHFSDLHGQRIGENQSAIRKAIEGKSYSCVVFTGDMIGQEGDAAPFLELVSLLPADVPKMYIPGDSDPPMMNPAAHESLSVYAAWAEKVAAAGVILLDEPVCFTRNKSNIWFVPEYLYSLDLDGMEAAYKTQLEALSTEGVILTPDQAAQKRVVEYHLERIARIRTSIRAMKEDDIQVALSHTPLTHEYVSTMMQWQDKTKVFSIRRVSLVLSGHYAGGQWRWPWGGAVYVPEIGFAPDDSLICGLDYVGGIPQYISPGLAASPYYPWQPGRLFNAPEVTYIALTSRLK